MTRVVFFNIGWMNRYNGLRAGDPISGGGAWVDEHGVGGEAYNFKPYRNRLYGYVRPPGGGQTINIERIGANADYLCVDDVLVAWVAKHPAEGGLRLVAWYRNARVHWERQDAPPGASRPVKRWRAEYFAECSATDGVLLDTEDRVLFIPRNREGAMGQSNVWFADSELGRKTVKDVLGFIRRYERGQRKHRSNQFRGLARSADPVHRARVETAAVRAVVAHYQGLGFKISDVQRDNQGWDLEATRGGEKLLLEVKGLSGSQAVAELTPNEYKQMHEQRRRYRLCIVVNALEKNRREMRLFTYLGQKLGWVDQDDRRLEIAERTAARVLAR